MIDTLDIQLNDYKIKKEYQIQIIQGILNMTTGEIKGERTLYKSKDFEIIAKKAYLNTKHFRFDLTRYGAFISTTVPRWFYNSNYYPINKDQLILFGQQLQKELDQNGILTNVYNADICRMDIFKNGIMKNSPIFYLQTLDLLSGKRVKKEKYKENILFKNTQREVFFYDKYIQLQDKGYNISDIPINSLRGEVRFTTKQSIKRFIDSDSKFGRLQSYFKDLPEIYIQQMKDIIFYQKFNFEGITNCIEDERQKLEYLIQNNKSKKSIVKQWIYNKGVYTLINEFGDMKSVKNLLSEFLSKNTVRDNISRMEKAFFEETQFHQQTKNIIKYYQELCDVFLNNKQIYGSLTMHSQY